MGASDLEGLSLDASAAQAVVAGIDEGHRGGQRGQLCQAVLPHQQLLQDRQLDKGVPVDLGDLITGQIDPLQLVCGHEYNGKIHYGHEYCDFDIQCIQKLFRPFTLWSHFVMLQPYAKIF